MIKLAVVVGNRPQLVKYWQFFANDEQFAPVDMIYTGQHYDSTMKDAFFDGLLLPAPKVDLGLTKPGEILDKLIEVLKDYDGVIVYGDTHSSLMGALAGAYNGIPVIHIEAGLRSDNMLMPEEINRRAIDTISTIKLCPSKSAFNNLITEGISEWAYIVGDVMFDTLGRFLPMGRNKKNSHYLLTLHRQSNVDDKDKLNRIMKQIGKIKGEVIFPCHPRTRKNLDVVPNNVKLIDPVPYIDMIALTYDAIKVITDSGGLQKEAFWLSTPCITLRDETEWTETLQGGWNILANEGNLLDIVNETFVPTHQKQPYGGGQANQHIEKVLKNNYDKIKNFKKT